MQPHPMLGFVQTTHDLRDPRIARQQQQQQYAAQPGGAMTLQAQQLAGVPALSQPGVVAARPQQVYAASTSTLGVSGPAPQQIQPQMLQPAWAAGAAALQPISAGQGYMQHMPGASGQLQLQQPPKTAATQHGGLLMTQLQNAAVPNAQQAAVPVVQQQQQLTSPLQLQTVQLQSQQQQQQQQMPASAPSAFAGQQPRAPTTLGQSLGGSSTAGPRPMKRQAYQSLQGHVPKRPQHGTSNYYRSGSNSEAAEVTAMDASATGASDVTATAGDGAAAAAPNPAASNALPGPRVGVKPFPGEVQMLADMQELMMTIMQYMVKHRQFSSSGYNQGYVQQQQQQVSGYDLCRFKQDFVDKYKYELSHKEVGHTKVKDLIMWLMGHALEMKMSGHCGSHMVLYPLSSMDYAQFQYLDCDRILEHFATHMDPIVVAKLPSIKQQIEQYKQQLSVAATGQQNDEAADGSAALAAATGSNENGPTAVSFAGNRASEVVEGLTVPLGQVKVQQLQQLQPQQQLARFLRRELIELRVAARRTAVAEAWTNSYMKLDEQVDSILDPQQQGAAAAEAGPGSKEQQDAAAGAAGGSAAAAEEDSSLLKGLDEDATTATNGQSDAASEAAGNDAAKEDDKALLQGLEQDDAVAAGTNAEPATAGPAQPDSSSAGSIPPPGVRVKAAGSGPYGGGDNKYQAGIAVRAKELLAQWPLMISELMSRFAAEQPAAHQQLLQVMSTNGVTISQVIKDLIAASQQPLQATLVDPKHPEAAAGEGQQHQEEKLWATEPSASDVGFVITLYERIASLLVDINHKGGASYATGRQETSLYDPPGFGGRPGLATMLLRQWPELRVQQITQVGVASLEELLAQKGLFGRLLTVRVVETPASTKVMVQSHVNARADLLQLLERRMVQLVGAGLRTATTCCTLPALAGYRLDRLKQDFALEYGYPLQQGQLGGSSFKGLMEGFPDYCYYKTHQRSTLVMHPSPVMHLRLLLRLLLAPVAAAVTQQGGKAVDSAGAESTGHDTCMANGDTSGSGGKILAAVTASMAAPVMGTCSGFSAPTARYPGCPSALVKASLELVATAVEAALAPHHSMAVEGPGGAKMYPVVAVQQAFQAVYGYSMPLYKLGVENFKQLLLELDAECNLQPKHKLTGDPPPNVPEVWYVTLPRDEDKGRQSSFADLYLKRLAVGKAMTLYDWEPTPLSGGGASAAAISNGGNGSGFSSIPALGGSAGIPALGGYSSSGRGALSGRHGSGDYSSGGRQQWGGAAAAGGGGASRSRVMAAVADVLRRKLANVPPAYDANGQRTTVPTELGYRLNNLQSDLMAATGISLNLEALGFKNLVQLVGALPDVATIVFSPDRQHRVFPPKPASAAPMAGGSIAAGGPVAGGVLPQPPPPPRANPAVQTPGMTATGHIPGLGMGAGGPLGMTGLAGGVMAGAAAPAAVGGAAGGDLGGSLGLGTSLGFNAMAQQQSQQQQQQQWQMQMAMQLQQQQQQAQQAQQQQRAQQQAQQDKIAQTTQMVTAVMEAARKLGMTTSAVPTEALAALVAAAAAASGQALSPEAVQLATVAIQAMSATQQAASAATTANRAVAAPAMSAPMSVPQAGIPGLGSFATSSAAGPGAQHGPGATGQPAASMPMSAPPPGTSSTAAAADGRAPGALPTAAGAQEKTDTAIKQEALDATPQQGPTTAGYGGAPQLTGPPSWQGQQQQQRQLQKAPDGSAAWAAGAAAQTPTTTPQQAQQQQQQQQRPAPQYQQPLPPPRGTRPPPPAAAPQQAAAAATGAAQAPYAMYGGPPKGAGATGGAYGGPTAAQVANAQGAGAAAGQASNVYQQQQAGTQGAAAAHLGQLGAWGGAAAAAAGQQPPPPGQNASQADQEAYMKWYAEYTKYCHDMAVYEQQMRQWQAQQAATGSAAGVAPATGATAAPPMPPDPPPADTKPAAAAAAAVSDGSGVNAMAHQQQQMGGYGFNPYQQVYGQQQPQGVYGQVPAAGYSHAPGAQAAGAAYGYAAGAAAGQQAGAYPYGAYPQQYPYGH